MITFLNFRSSPNERKLFPVLENQVFHRADIVTSVIVNRFSIYLAEIDYFENAKERLRKQRGYSDDAEMTYEDFTNR